MASFAYLPPELLCLILESAPDFSTVVALTLTSRLFHTTWMTHSHSIAAIVTPRVISNLTSAESLASAQEATESQPSPSLQQQDQYVQVVSRLRRLLHNAHLTSLVCDRWDTACANKLYQFRTPKDSHVSPSERLRFQRAFYHLWTLSIMPPSKRSSLLTGCTAREFGQLGEMAVWVMDYDDNGMVSLGLDIRNSMWTDSCDEIYTRWTRWLSDLGAPDLKASAFSAFLDSTRECLEPVPDSMRWRWAR